MSAQKFEAFLAKLYVDDNARSRFLADARREASNAGLTDEECAAALGAAGVAVERGA